MGITDPAEIRRAFPRYFPLGLGVNSTSPQQLARAFAVFGNQGRAVTPIAIRLIEDRNGRVVFDIERELRQRQRRMGESIQIISPQNAYVMTKIMEKTVEVGTLASGAGRGSKFTFRDENGTYRLPVAGKSGTTQNWADAWAVGYSPYYTTAVWFGFDMPGNSLGVGVAGATLSGPVWGDYMRIIHQGLPRRNFHRPSSGVMDMVVCSRSGLIRTPHCNEGEVLLSFLEGTQPNRYCEIHGSSSPFETKIPVRPAQFGEFDPSDFVNSLRMPQLMLDDLPELRDILQSDRSPNTNTGSNLNRNQNTGRNQPGNRTPANTGNTNTRNNSPFSLFNNPLLDDDLSPDNTSTTEVMIPAVTVTPVPEQNIELSPEPIPESFSPEPLDESHLESFYMEQIVTERTLTEHALTVEDIIHDEALPSWNSLE
jgi:penicillin-binding protein 1A